MKVHVKDGKVELKIEGEFNSEQLQELIFQIGDARKQIASDPDSLSNADMELPVVTSPTYWTEHSDRTHNQTLFAFKHPGIGWLGVILAPLEVSRLIGYFGNQLVRGATIAGTTEAATPLPEKIEGGGLLH